MFALSGPLFSIPDHKISLGNSMYGVTRGVRSLRQAQALPCDRQHGEGRHRVLSLVFSVQVQQNLEYEYYWNACCHLRKWRSQFPNPKPLFSRYQIKNCNLPPMSPLLTLVTTESDTRRRRTRRRKRANTRPPPRRCTAPRSAAEERWRRDGESWPWRLRPSLHPRRPRTRCPTN